MSSIELKGLKRLQGLDILLTDAKSERLTENIFSLGIDRLISGKYQPRTDFNDDLINELAQSIKSQGIILPLIVRQTQDSEKFEIIAGERRWRGAKIAGLKTVPAVIRNISDETALAFSLIENIQRENLNSIDEAMAFIRLKDEFSMTHEEIAERVGRSRSSVTNLIRLITLNADVKELLRFGKLEMGHARALLSLSEKNQSEVAAHIVSRGLSVRETEKLVQQVKIPKKLNHSAQNEFADKVTLWERRLGEKLSSSVRILLNSKGGGKIVINAESHEDIEWLIDQIQSKK